MDFEPDAYEGKCSVCGRVQVFRRERPAVRETYHCANCKASLRERLQAAEIVAEFGGDMNHSLVELVESPKFRKLKIYEPGTAGPFRKFLRGLQGYVQSVYNDPSSGSVAPGGMRVEDLHALTFSDESFDLIITSDILEHVRKPEIVFKEIRRILKHGGFHIFTVPLRWPIPEKSLSRVDTSTSEDIFLVPAQYHGDGRGGKSLVYTSFGLDLVDTLTKVGFVTEIRSSNESSDSARCAATFVSWRN